MDQNILKFSTAANNELLLRIGSALVLGPLAIATAYAGEFYFVAFWLLAAILIWREWIRLVLPAISLPVLGTGILALSIAAILVETIQVSLLVVALAAVALLVLVPRGRKRWLQGGLIYVAALLLAPVILRQDPDFGFAAIAFLFGIVWSTDIVAYFVGRAVGGPKLWSRVSPKKTWSGAIGGLIGAVLCALLLAKAFKLPNLTAIALLSVILSIGSQAGDLFESGLKRHFGVKDSGHLIPGHGGLMDRLDGFLIAASIAALIGFARGGVQHASQGLLIW